MKKFICALMGCFLTTTVLYAQADHILDAQTLQTDSIILHQILLPAIQNAGQQHQEPDWAILRTTITTRYDNSYAERNVTKGKIYYFYGKDWAQFSSAIVQYTQNYECKDSLPLMNKNAKMILSRSQNPSDWKAAETWVKYASEKEPSNQAYKSTYEALEAKINGR